MDRTNIRSSLRDALLFVFGRVLCEHHDPRVGHHPGYTLLRTSAYERTAAAGHMGSTGKACE